MFHFRIDWARHRCHHSCGKCRCDRHYKGKHSYLHNLFLFDVFLVASRVTMIFGGMMLILFGVVTKLGALLSSIPDPLVGVVLATSMSMVGGVAIANVQVRRKDFS